MPRSPHDIASDAQIETVDVRKSPPGRNAILAFVLPSLLGVLAFLTPIKVDGNWTILMGLLSDATTAFVGDAMNWVVLMLLWASVIGTVLAKFSRGIDKQSMVARLFMVAPVWVALRSIGAVMGTMTIFQFGPEMFWQAGTGGTVMRNLVFVIVPLFLFAGLLMPFLTDYGLMEFVGTMLKRVFRVLFTLPGRSAIDALASWMSAAPVGVMITIQQYITGHYMAREAAVIATNFSVVSVPFALVVANTVGVGHMFPTYYAAVILTGVVTAMIMPRIWPLSGFPDTPYRSIHPLREQPTSGGSLFREAIDLATRRAARAIPVRQQLRASAGHILDIWFGLVPAVIAVGGAGMMLANYTPVLQWLTLPLVPLLEWLAIPEAAAAAPALIAGFLDMFLPALLVANVEAEITRFIIGVISVTQLIYMSEVGILMVKCEIPLRFHHLVIIFLLRTIIGLPIVLAFAHWLVY
ncbi:MAG: YjiH family protein [Woeseiaceae bacterium]|nr:YjiH family protein [Woeseiaceae bacterium]